MSSTTFTPAPTKAGPLVFSDEQLLELLRDLTDGDNTLSRNSFAARRLESDPIAHLYELRFGSWNQALAAAGLNTIEQPPQLKGLTTKWDNDTMCAAIALCRDETGNTALAVYESWRTHPSNQHRLDLPPATTIRARFGKWSTATALVCAPPTQES